MRVELVIEGEGELVALRLNDLPISAEHADRTPRRFLICDALLARNRLEILVKGSLPIEVRLEIFEPGGTRNN